MNYKDMKAPELGSIVFFCFAPFLIGLFHTWTSMLAVLTLSALLAAAIMRGKNTVIKLSPLITAALIIPLSFALSSFWAVDRGMVWLGVLKFLPLPFFAFLAAKVSPGCRSTMIRSIPYTGAVMTILSGCLSFVPALRPFLMVNGRLAGFFQCPNTFAGYLAAGLMLILMEENRRPCQSLAAVVLLFGIVWSGSRAALLLTGAGLILCTVLPQSKKTRRINLLLTLCTFFAGAVYLLFRSGWDLSALSGTLLLRSSTVRGRFLYARDALPVILKHPLGLGYLGYAFSEGGFQTGVYSVTHVHNDWLQILLDIGWIPFLVCIWAVWDGFSKTERRSKVAASVLLLHALADFDLQFAALDFVLILLLTPDRESGFTFRGRSVPLLVCISLCGMFSLWIGSSSFLYYIGENAISHRIYPGNTYAVLNLMSGAEEQEERAAYAAEILSRNKHCFQAYRVMARKAFSEGDIQSMIDCAEKGIACAKYDLDGYLDYIDMLSVAISMYGQVGDAYSEAFCRERLAAIPELLKTVKETTSPLAWKITDQPKLDLPEDYAARLDIILKR